MPADRVELVATTVEPVLTHMRELARTCSATAWALTCRTPLMPPRFTMQWEADVRAVVAGLRVLAGELEIRACTEATRVGRLETAGGQPVSVPLSNLVSDLRVAGAEAWQNVDQERASDQLVDPFGRDIHAIMGAVDSLASLWHTAGILVQGGAPFATRTSAGRKARHELVAMGINLFRLAPLWTVLEPEDSLAAAGEVVGRAIDVQDLQSGDVARWAGHIGAGLALGKAVDAGVAEDGEAISAAMGRTYTGVGRANQLPSTNTRKAKSFLGRQLAAAEDRAADFLERSVP
ncbi:MAG: hypothetical protein ABR573_10605 [Candidatus Dormibacteria bacterium]